jgi:3-deoxy-D-manno-octulosonic-acid transferase
MYNSGPIFNYLPRMRYFYNLFLHLMLPYVLFRLYWKGRRLRAYRERVSERFSFNLMTSKVDVWLHANSLGEVVAATPLIDALLAKQLSVLVTTMTPTGSQQVKRRFGQQVLHQYVPYDFSWAVRRFFKRISIRMGIIIETELWPNLIYGAKLANVPLIVANARLSDKSFKSYEKIRWFYKPILNQLTMVLAQSSVDAQRFLALGVPAEKVCMLGNMKFDLQTNLSNNAACLQLKTTWGSSRPVLIAASTHDDEENQLLLRLKTLQIAMPHLVLLIAPRHPERFKTVYELSQKLGYKTGLRSQSETITNDKEVIVLDSLGELLGFYQNSDYAFVGGSLVPIGGHNVLEPIAMQVPVFCGPYMQNSKAICADLLAAKAIQIAANADELIGAIAKMYKNREIRAEQIKNATAVLEANRGTVARHLEQIERILPVKGCARNNSGNWRSDCC